MINELVRQDWRELRVGDIIKLNNNEVISVRIRLLVKDEIPFSISSATRSDRAVQ